MDLKQITDYLDKYLEVPSFNDESSNGLQVENSGVVNRIALAVDACLEAILKCAEAACTMLIVHHGLFWGKESLLLGTLFRRIRALIMSDTALYAVHLPLDAHPEVGNNIQIARVLGLKDVQSFAMYRGKPIGIKGLLHTPTSFPEVLHHLNALLGPCTATIQYGPEQVHSIGIVAGSATDPSLFQEVRMQGIDLLVTGEPKHGAYHLAQELGLNIFYGGHYRSETFGPKALGEHIQKHLGIPTVFLDAPSPF